MRPLLRLTLPLALAACAPRPAERPAARPTAPAADSIALERTACFGPCPVYRVVIVRDGAVEFTSQNPVPVAVEGRASPEAFRTLAEEAERIGFRALPPSIAGSPLCGRRRTDAPGAVVTLYAATAVRVADDHGCEGAPASLRRYQARIDSAAGTSRWVRAAVPR
jgi:hypothetical protein